MVHVFVVDNNTFKYHLEYLFAGTGAKDKQSPFLSNKNLNYNAATERMLVGMIADISRIRIGDKIIFYLQASVHGQGSFYGVFKASSNPFFDENDSNNYLASQTQKGLSFRILITGYEVYPKGITEHDYLDSLEGKIHPHELCWSLIYRKLKGNRGCTMITDYEFNDLYNRLKITNNNIPLINSNFTFNILKNEIENLITQKKYDGRNHKIDIEPRLLNKLNKKNAFETHLQAYLTQNLDNPILAPLFVTLTNSPCWIGNEVACGVGMQRIDLLLIQENSNEVLIRVIELKDERPFLGMAIQQLHWYLEWLSFYVIPNYKGKNINIIPTIVANGKPSEKVLESYLAFNQVINGAVVNSLQYIGFSETNNSLYFTRYL